MKQKTRAHRILFDNDSPYKQKVVKDRTKYTRKNKHNKGNDIGYSTILLA
jgi:nitrogen fixation-related uncharacterized protein